MKYNKKLKAAILIERVNRFLGVIDLEGEEKLCFIPNPGRMKELMIPGTTVYVLEKTGIPRKTDYDMILLEKNKKLISIDSRFPNKLFAEEITKQTLEPFRDYFISKKEPTFMDSRLDFLLTKENKQALIECKSCNLVENGTALFPDAPTKRGARHMSTLIEGLKFGRSGVVFIIQRSDAKIFKPYHERDPEFTETLEEAAKKGVEVYAYNCKIDLNQIHVNERIPVEL
jgi:sugar fermentation stimulation protein A